MKEIILKHALKNAVVHGGKAAAGAVIGGILGQHRDVAQLRRDGFVEDAGGVVGAAGVLHRQEAQLRVVGAEERR